MRRRTVTGTGIDLGRMMSYKWLSNPLKLGGHFESLWQLDYRSLGLQCQWTMTFLIDPPTRASKHLQLYTPRITSKNQLQLFPKPPPRQPPPRGAPRQLRAPGAAAQAPAEQLRRVEVIAQALLGGGGRLQQLQDVFATRTHRLFCGHGAKFMRSKGCLNRILLGGKI